MPYTVTWSETATLRFGPLFVSWSTDLRSTVIKAAIASLAIYLVLLYCYATTALVHTYPTDYTNFWFGLIHGYFVIPSFVLSWFIHDVTIYQSPNDGFWYNLGFLAGCGWFLGYARSAD